MSRLAAIRVLEAVETREAFSNVALDQELRRRRLDPRDAALATELVYGVLENRPFLDAALERWLKKPLGKLPDTGRAALRLGAYQLIFLERVPDHAAISETVELVKRRAGWMAGLTNAVLRRIAEHRDDLRGMLREPVDSAERLGLVHGLPLGLAQRLVGRLGLEQATRYAQALQTPTPVTLRIRDPARRSAVVAELCAAGVTADATPYSPAGAHVIGGGRPAALAPVRQGRAVVEDEGAQLAGLWAAPEPGWTVLDLCAGRGGKTFHLADQMGGQGRVVATDSHAGKLSGLAHGAARLGIDMIEVVLPEEDGRAPQLDARFDLVVVDAPCSGTGVLRRHPERRDKVTAERVAELVALQRRLLRRALTHVAPAGRLVYIVCSDLPEEGAEQVAWLLDERPELRRASPPGGLDWTPLLDSSGDLALEVHRHHTDGFFATRLEKSTQGRAGENGAEASRVQEG